MDNSTISRPVRGIFTGHPVLSTIHVFKTNIGSAKEVEEIAPVLSGETRIMKWNIDLDDIDNILRVESNELTTPEITELILQAGYQCEELPD